METGLSSDRTIVAGTNEFIDLNNNILSASIGVFTLPSEIDPYNFRDLLILYAIPAGVLWTQNRRLLRR